MEQKKTKIEIYVDEDGQVVSIIEGKGIDLLSMMMAVIDDNDTFRKLVHKAEELLPIMKDHEPNKP